MKILYYSPHPQLKSGAPTGYGTHIREMIAAWRKMGVEVKTLIGGDFSGDPIAKTPEKGSKKRLLKRFIPPLLWESLKDLQLVRFDREMEKKLSGVIDEYKPDVVYERVAYLQNSGVRIATRKKVRHISEINAPYPEERLSFSGKSWMLRTARDNEREILIKTNAVVTVSSELRDYFENVLPGVAEKTFVLPNSVNPDVPEISQKQLDDLRSNLGVQGCFVIGFVGSVFPYHGVDLLIDAFAVQKDKEKLRLLIVGDGESIPALKAAARKSDILQYTIFAGSVPHREVYAYIELMDICCMAKSNWYGSPVKIFEYGLMKKPVIAPNVSPVRDVMNSESGMIVDPNVNSIARAMTQLIEDRTLRDRLAENWHRQVLENHTWEITAKKALDLCE